MVILSEPKKEVKRFKIRLFKSLSVKEYEDTPENSELLDKLKQSYGNDNVQKVEVIENDSKAVD